MKSSKNKSVKMILKFFFVYVRVKLHFLKVTKNSTSWTRADTLPAIWVNYARLDMLEALFFSVISNP